MPTPGQELSSIDFEAMLGGPLVAVVHAQAQAAMSTVNFIKEVGFTKGRDNQDPTAAVSEVGDPIYVRFKYPKESAPYQPPVLAVGDAQFPNGLQPYVPQSGTTPAVGNAAYPSGLPPYRAAQNAVAAVYVTQVLEVPILTMLPIPFIRIDTTTIDFNAKINSTEYTKTDSTFQIGGELEAKAGWLWGSAKLKVSSSYKSNTQQGATVERTYSMAVQIKAVQDEMPAGMEKILSILENAMKAQPEEALTT